MKIPNEEYVGANGYIVKLSPDGSKVLWGSYVGTSIECRDLVIDNGDNLYLTFGWLKDSVGELPASWLAKFSPTGKLLAATCLGGRGDEINGPDTLSVDKDGSVLITSGWGSTSPDYPVTAGCFQPSLRGKNNAVFSLLSNDLGTLLCSTYMGGEGANLHANGLAPDGSIWVAGKGFVYFSGRGGKDVPLTPGSFLPTLNGTNQRI